MIMTLVNALLQPNYILSNQHRYPKECKINPYRHYEDDNDDLRTSIISADNIRTEYADERKTITQIDIKTPNGHSFNTERINKCVVNENKKLSMKCMKEISTINAHKPRIYKQIAYYRKKKYANSYGRKQNHERRCKSTIVADECCVHVQNFNLEGVLRYKNNIKCNVKRKYTCICNMNIKHLKLFNLINNLNIYHLYVYLDKCSRYNVFKNTHINDIYNSTHKIIIYNLYSMPNLEEVKEIYMKLPADLYNILALKVVEMTFVDNDWQKLEQLLNILCNTTNGNLNGFDIVWWNMQTCWTSFKKNPNSKWIKEFTVNCEVIPEDEEEIMVVYTIIDGKNVPINLERRSKQVLIELISKL